VLELMQMTVLVREIQKTAPHR